MKYIILLLPIFSLAPVIGDKYYFLDALRIMDKMQELNNKQLILEREFKKVKYNKTTANLVFTPNSDFIIVFRQLEHTKLASLIYLINELETEIDCINKDYIAVVYAEKVVDVQRVNYLYKIEPATYITEFGRKLTIDSFTIKEIL